MILTLLFFFFVGLYLEAETNTTAWLLSPIFQPQLYHQSTGLCLLFRYRNNHKSSQLKVIVNTLYNKTDVWQMKGMQGSKWNEAKIPWPDDLVSQVCL